MNYNEIEVFVEIPRGSNNKYEYDKKRKKFILDRVLFSPVYYPADYGFVEETYADDGDPLDALVITSFPTFPGCTILARIIGVFIMRDEKGRDEKIIGVPVHDPRFEEIQKVADLGPHIKKEFEHFFSVYKNLENKEVDILGWEDVDSAIQIIKKAKEDYTKAK